MSNDTDIIVVKKRPSKKKASLKSKKKKSSSSASSSSSSSSSSKSQKPKIAYLGWGSLLWSSKKLKVPEWHRTELKLPLEFSRASDGGFGRLTLVIDPKNGTENRVWIGETTHKNIDSAIKAIREREGSKNPHAIAFINLKSKKTRIIHTPEHIVKRIYEYAKKHNHDAIIWTDLPSNWEELKYCKFTNENVINYFRFLPMDIQLKILTYIYQASRIGRIHTTFSTYLFKHLAEFSPNSTIL